MAYVFHALAALAVVAIAGAGAATPLVSAWAAIAALPVPYVLAFFLRRAIERANVRSAVLFARLSAAAPLLSHAAVLFATDWLAFAELARIERLGAWPGPELLIALLPFAVFEAASIDARVRLVGDGGKERPRRAYALRTLASAFAPLVVFIAITWPLAFAPVWRVHVEEVQLLGIVHLLAALAVVATALPFVVRFLWDTRPLAVADPISRALTAIAERARFRCRRLLLWRTGDSVANAAIVGFTPRTRYVLFSDALLARLAPRQVAAVFAHEVGHAIRRHLFVFLVFTLGVFAAVDVVLAWITREVAGSGLDAPLAFATAAVAFGLWYVAFGWLSRRFELDADLVALEITGDPVALASALDDVVGLHARSRPSWRHFSVAQRATFLRAAARDPGAGARLRRDLRVSTIAIAVLATLAIAAELAMLASARHGQMANAELRLGRFSAALARLEAGGAGAGPSAELARVGLSVGDGADRARLVDAARRAEESGDRERAGLLVELAALRERIPSTR